MQAKMAQSSVLYIHVTGLSSEIMKNLVLAGIRAVICDGRPYPDAIQDTPSLFITKEDLVSHIEPPSKKAKRTVADIMKLKIEELNPLLGECQICTDDPCNLTSEFLSQFRIVVASRMASMADAIRIADICTNAGNKFFMADCFGFFGVSVFDLGKDHTYRPELGKTLLEVTALKSHVPLGTILRNVPLEDAINRFHKAPPPAWIRYRCLLEYVERRKVWPSAKTSADFVQTISAWIETSSPSLKDIECLTPNGLEELALTATSEIAPVCSVLGGILGNEIIKAISGKGEPANNTILFDGVACKAWTFLVQPKA
jgi:ubiquitin-like 1-activating enzyme E1 A